MTYGEMWEGKTRPQVKLMLVREEADEEAGNVLVTYLIVQSENKRAWKIGELSYLWRADLEWFFDPI